MAVERTATAEWSGTIVEGSGRILTESGALGEQPISLLTRVAEPAGRTSPEELIAAAHAACFAMSIAAVLTERGTPPSLLTVDARCVEGPVPDGYAITGIQLDVVVAAPDLSAEMLPEIVASADAGCPVSRALRGNVPVTISSRLQIN